MFSSSKRPWGKFPDQNPGGNHRLELHSVEFDEIQMKSRVRLRGFHWRVSTVLLKWDIHGVLQFPPLLDLSSRTQSAEALPSIDACWCCLWPTSIFLTFLSSYYTNSSICLWHFSFSSAWRWEFWISSNFSVGSLGSLQWAVCAALLTEWQGHWCLTQMCPQNSYIGPLHMLVRRSGHLMCWWRLLLWTAFHISLDIWTYFSRHPVWVIIFCGAGQ